VEAQIMQQRTAFVGGISAELGFTRTCLTVILRV
jgi:hypothetical protein